MMTRVLPCRALLAFGICAAVVSISAPAWAQLDRATVEADRNRQKEHEAAGAQLDAIKRSMAADDRDRSDQAASIQKMHDQIEADYQRARAIEIRRNARWQSKPSKSQAAWNAKTKLEWEQRDREAAAAAAAASPPR